MVLSTSLFFIGYRGWNLKRFASLGHAPSSPSWPWIAVIASSLVSLLLSYSPSVYSNYHIAAILRCFTVISFLSFAQNLFSASHLIQNEAKLFAMAQSLLSCYLYCPFVPASLASFLILEHETLFPPGIYTQGSLCLVSSPRDLHGSHSHFLQIFA